MAVFDSVRENEESAQARVDYSEGSCGRQTSFLRCAMRNTLRRLDFNIGRFQDFSEVEAP